MLRCWGLWQQQTGGESLLLSSFSTFSQRKTYGQTWLLRSLSVGQGDAVSDPRVEPCGTAGYFDMNNIDMENHHYLLNCYNAPEMSRLWFVLAFGLSMTLMSRNDV